MERKSKENKSWSLLIGSFIFLCGTSLLLYDYYSNKKIDKIEQNAIENYYEEETILEPIIDSTEEPQKKEEVKENINYIAILKIPKIRLERGLVDPNSYLNNVKYNLQWIEGTSMPDQENGNVIIAGHSGSSRVSYFKKLDQLVIGDLVSLDYKNKIYNYKIVDIYDIEKTGTAEIIKNQNTTTLTLITCRHNTNKQIVIICELIKE